MLVNVTANSAPLSIQLYIAFQLLFEIPFQLHLELELNLLEPFEKSARQPCLHYFSACGEIPGLKVFVTASGTVEQDTCSIIVDCRLKSPDKVEKIYSFFNKTRLRH